MGRWKMGAAGALYGAGLVVAGVMLAGAGHGTSIMLDIASTPFSFLGSFAPLIFPPLMWGTVGWFLARAWQRIPRWIVFSILLLHYLSFLLVPLVEQYNEGEYLAKMFAYAPLLVIVSIAYYLGGQVLVWVLWLNRTAKGKQLRYGRRTIGN